MAAADLRRRLVLAMPTRVAARRRLVVSTADVVVVTGGAAAPAAGGGRGGRANTAGARGRGGRGRGVSQLAPNAETMDETQREAVVKLNAYVADLGGWFWRTVFPTD